MTAAPGDGAVALLVAAGRGDRLGGEQPKAFVTLGGRPLLEHAVGAALACPEVAAAVVAVPPGREADAERLLGGASVTIVPGGPTRQESVRAALATVPPETDAVVVHDVARPFAEPDLFSRVLAALSSAEGAILVVAVTDTVKRIEGGVVAATLRREGLCLAQTPQAFRREALDEAHRRADEEGIAATDDAGLLERAGFRVAAVPGDPRNLKITTPFDLEVAEAVLRAPGGVEP